MEHLHDLANLHLDRPSVVTIGVFDGLHRGHQYLIKRLVAEARATQRLAVVITFYPHPDVVLRGLTGRYYLTTPDERAALMGALGVDYVITLPFDEQLRHIRAAAFVSRLREHLRLDSLWVGADFALGYQREGDVAFLRAQGEAHGFSVQVIELLMQNGDHTLSSSVIRDALSAGDLDAANAWLGRAYSVRGEVVHGDHRGRTIGFPTANIAVWSEQLIPANGVYAGWALLGAERYIAATNVGMRPTFDGKTVTVEAHLLDFSREIYGEQLTFTFEKRLRPEQRFNGIEALIAQIHADAEAARRALMG